MTPAPSPPTRPGALFAAPASGSGKTVTTLAVIAALCRRGHTVAPAKVGPDYIDTAFLTAAAGTQALNLDPWAMGAARLTALAAMPPGTHLIAEGVMGLFDGSVAGGGSTADLAKTLKLPVVLVVSPRGMSQSIGALVHGFATYDRDVRVAGVILAGVASARHEAMLRAALPNTPCLGALPRDGSLALPSRHLGLVQAAEHPGLAALIDRAATLAEAHIDLAAIAALSRPAPSPPRLPPRLPPLLPPLGQRIAVAQDTAFAFTYAHILADWRAAGAETLPFSPLANAAPDPLADAIFLPGGYPELFAARLAQNATFLRGLREAASAGALIYGECGGHMVLGKTLTDADGVTHQMAGLLPHTSAINAPRRTLGYRTLTHDGRLPWPKTLRGHEFHYASAAGEGPPLFHAGDAAGAPRGPMGSVAGRVMGSFAHIIDAPS
ncbi:MAG: cobyrinate a,c-diamide synthase [Pseudomonadota bacterium]